MLGIPGLNEEYQAPKSEDVTVDPQTGGVNVEKVVHDLHPWEQIVQASTQFGIEIKEPNQKCKLCKGEGFLGIEPETGIPNPCDCIYVNKDDMNRGGVKMTREERRKIQRMNNNILKKFKRKVRNAEK